jgi:hypothetical protein
MDGMGESYRAMVEDMMNLEDKSGDYMHDIKLIKSTGGEGFIGVPRSLNPGKSSASYDRKCLPCGVI